MLNGTNYLPWWMKLYGMHMDKLSVVSSTEYMIDPDMITIGKNVSASSVSYETTVLEGGFIIREPTLVGDNCFIGNMSSIEGGSKLGERNAVAAMTRITSEESCISDATWLGIPATKVSTKTLELGVQPVSNLWMYFFQMLNFLSGFIIMAICSYQALRYLPHCILFGAINVSQ